ncbi:MAG: NnrS family protein [Marinobacter sp.]|uniref:NnrS family protein n=1 Tax=Marinobacter sp. TaxID=50741 RepID=UPI00299EB2D1|nr:NnrS family protein [Marinobacter sp.]MDX1755455.1 NnrS family protein [Marinobacter sp.]
MQAIPTAQATVSPSIAQLFAYPFRIFFLSMALLAVLAIPAWVLVVTGSLSFPTARPGLFWHQHEMLFGFLSAAIAGFLLTAVCVWTQTTRTHGPRLALLWGVWLAGRLLLAFGGDLPFWLVQGVNLSFLPLVMVDAGWRIWQARQKRQFMILLVLGLMWAMQTGFVTTFDAEYLQGAVIMALALITIIGGRITPAFTRNWLRQTGGNPDSVRTLPALDLASVLALLLLLFAGVLELPALAAPVATLAALLALTRLAVWQGWRSRWEPLVWMLHLSMAWVPVALGLFAAHLWLNWPANAWLHAAGTGAIACMILGVIARVALGHTGRPLSLPRGMVTAFLALHLAAVIRVATALGLLPWPPGIGTATLLWELAFILFLIRYTGILASPRPDGRPG